MNNQFNTPADKPIKSDNKKTSTKLKTGEVKDAISKGRTAIGNNKPDEININPMQEAINSEFENYFETDLNELNIQQRMKKALNIKKIENKLQLARKRALLRRGSGKTIAKRAKVLAINTLKSKLAGNRDPSTLSPMEKQRVEDILKQRKGAVNRLALRLIPQTRKKEAKRFLKVEEFDLTDIHESIEIMDEMINSMRKDTHKRDEGTDTLVKIYKNDTPGETKTVDEDFESFIEAETREALPRSGQPRKTIDLVVRSDVDRKVSTKPYRQQEIQKKIIDEDLHDIVDTLDEAISMIDKGEYDYEGAMARTQLQTICRNAQDLVDMLKDDENMPEWVQSKITKAEDYISSVTDYLKSREELHNLDNKMYEDFNVHEDLRKWFDKNHPEGGWKRINSKGEVMGDCAREPGEPKPKCMSNEKRRKLTPKQRAYAVAAKRKKDPVANRSGKGGKPINVSNFGKGKISEETIEEACWDGYKKVGMKKKGDKIVPDCRPQNEEIEQIDEKNAPTNPALWSKAKTLARQKFDVYPSAYANGWASKWYKSKGGGWKTLKEETIDEAFEQIDEKVAAWQRKEGKNPEGGLNKAGVASYRRENPGSKLQTAVTTKPSKLKKGSKAANRRKSFCARMSGMKKKLTSSETANDPDSRINKSLRKWNC